MPNYVPASIIPSILSLSLVFAKEKIYPVIRTNRMEVDTGFLIGVDRGIFIYYWNEWNKILPYGKYDGYPYRARTAKRINQWIDLMRNIVKEEYRAGTINRFEFLEAMDRLDNERVLHWFQESMDEITKQIIPPPTDNRGGKLFARFKKELTKTKNERVRI